MRLLQEKQLQNVINFWEDVKTSLFETLSFVNPYVELLADEDIHGSEDARIEAYYAIPLRSSEIQTPHKKFPHEYEDAEYIWYFLHNIAAKGRKEFFYKHKIRVAGYGDKIKIPYPELITNKKVDIYAGYLDILSNIIKGKALKFGKYIIRLSIRPQAFIELYLFFEPKKPLLPVIDLIINDVDLSDEFKSKDRQEIFYILEKEGFAELNLSYETIQLIYKRLSDEPIHRCLWRRCSNPAKDGKAFCSSRCRWKMKQSLIHANKGKEPEVLNGKGNKIPLTKFLEEEYMQQIEMTPVDGWLRAKDDFWRNLVPKLEKEYGVRIRANPVGRPKKKN